MSNIARYSRHIPPRRTETAAGELTLVAIVVTVLIVASLLAFMPQLFVEPTTRDLLGWTWRAPQ